MFSRAKEVAVSKFWICAVTCLIMAQPGAAQPGSKTLGYRTCGTENNTCHVSDGKWWKADPHYSTVAELKRKKKRTLEIAQLYGMNPSDYLKGNENCAQCHGEVVTGRETKSMNTGVSCELCHGPAGPKGVGYLEVHQEGTPPKNPLDVSRTGYQKGLKVGLVELRNVNVRAKACVRCHLINEKKLLEAGHPTGEGFDYIKGIKNNISKHWDYNLRAEDTNEAPFAQAVRARPIPQFTVKSLNAPVADVLPGTGPTVTDTVFVYVEPDLPPWLNPDKTITIKPFEPGLSKKAPVDSMLWVIKSYIEYIHAEISK